MKISFEPTQLADAVLAPVLRRIVEELTPRGMLGEVAVQQKFRDDPMVLVLKGSRGAAARISIDREIFYSPGREDELRKTVQALFENCARAVG